MNKLRNLFGNLNMTWYRVIAFSVIIGVYTGLINQVPFLKDTSFRDIAISFECWIVFAIIIIVNCKKWWEAVLKCFVFFLISQPIVYLVEVPFLGWNIFSYYEFWFKVTLLTVPGSFIAFWVKKKNVLSAIILSVATGALACLGTMYLNETLYAFPKHLLSSIFCYVFAAVLIFVLLPAKKERIIAFAITGILLGYSVFAFFINPAYSTALTHLDSSSSWTCTVDDENLLKVDITNGCDVEMKSNHNGDTNVEFKSSDGKILKYKVTVRGSNHMIDMEKID